MTNIDKRLKEIRPSLKQIAPQTYWSSIGFGLFNVIIGLALITNNVLVTLHVVGIIPLNIWGVIFLIHGMLMLFAIATNSWKMARVMHSIAIVIKGAWWCELLAIVLTGKGAILLYIWSLLLFLQITIYYYFTPRVSRD